jgi:hypothetical protein
LDHSCLGGRCGKELDPDGILDKDTNNDNDGFVKRDGEAVDPCHTLSSSESEEEDSADANEKEMEVDNPAATSHAATPVPTTIIFEASTGSEAGAVPDLPLAAAAAAAGTAGTACTSTADLSAPVSTNTGTQSGSVSGYSTEVLEQKNDPGEKSNFNRFDPNSKLGKALLQNNFKIPFMPKDNAPGKVPTGVKNPGPKKTEKTVNPIPAEADAVPSKSYTKIISGKLLKGKVGTIGGITSSQGLTECGSFFNKGDNRVLRSVYKEEISSMSVSSLSFNPVKGVCASCPSGHPVFGGGEANRTVIVLADQNFPAVLPSCENKCLAIARLEKGTLDELVDFAIKITKNSITVPSGTVFVIGSLSHMERVGAQLYATACINAKRRLLGAFKKCEIVPFVPPPHGRLQQSGSDTLHC